MAMSRLLVQTQLSNYDSKGKFILECDSGWNMVMGRIREMLKLVPDLVIDVMGPRVDRDRQVITLPWDVNPDLPWNNIADWKPDTSRLNYIQHDVLPNALATRYDFNFDKLNMQLGLNLHKHDVSIRYDAVYINDPLHLKNFKALFLLAGGYRPKYFVHSHFIDDPSAPKFPTEASLWMGQVEAARKADFNFWQCESAMHIFFEEMHKEYHSKIVDGVVVKSAPWDDGYSATEISLPINEKNLRFDPNDVLERFKGKAVLFVPNRIGGQGRSSDYTNCGKFMFETLPALRARRQDFVVVAGNPSQKFFNHELEAECGPNGYISLVPDAFNRDEFRWIASHSDVAVALYDQDSYGGTAARECIELGCVPLWINMYEYATIAQKANWPYITTYNKDFSELPMMADALIETVHKGLHKQWLPQLQQVVRDRCSYESTTPAALEVMGLL